MKGPEVWGGGAPGSGGVTSLTPVGPTNLKRHSWVLSKKVKSSIPFCENCRIVKDHLWDTEATVGDNICPSSEIPTAEKNKKDLSELCGCEAFEFMHVKGFCKALERS